MNPRDTGRQHEPAPDDPARRHLRAAACPKARRTTASSAASRRSSAARAWCGSSSSRMNVWVNDPQLPRARQRARSRSSAPRTARSTSRFRSGRSSKKIKGLPAFTTVRGGAYFFLPGIRALRYLAAGIDSDAGADETPHGRSENLHAAVELEPGPLLQPGPRAAEVHAGHAARQRLRHLELSRARPIATSRSSTTASRR